MNNSSYFKITLNIFYLKNILTTLNKDGTNEYLVLSCFKKIN